MNLLRLIRLFGIALYGMLVTAGWSQDTLYVCNPGDPIQLHAPENQWLYQWLPDIALNNSISPNPIAYPLEHMTYVVRSIQAIYPDNLITNAHFDDGREGFNSEYQYAETIRTQGLYGINRSAANLNPYSFQACPDHTTGDGHMLVVDGYPETDKKVWCQNIRVDPHTDYIFTAWLTSVNPRNPARLQFSINDVRIGRQFSAPREVCAWNQFYEVWRSGLDTSATICIVNRNTERGGNDFAMDDFAFQRLEGLRYDTTVVLVEAIIEASKRRVFIPTIFSPNGDGSNDFFTPYLGKGALSMSAFNIYDRWGNQVFSRKDCEAVQSCHWDGRVNGVAAPEGAYVYRVQIEYADAYREILSGTVQLVR